MFNSKKADMSIAMIITSVLTFVVIVIVILSMRSDSGPKNLITKNVIENYDIENKQCELIPSMCKVNICNENSECSEKEKEKWEKYLKFKELCDLSSEEEKKEVCKGLLYEKITELTQQDSIKPNVYDTNPIYANTNQIPNAVLSINEGFNRDLYKQKLKLDDNFLNKVEDIAKKLDTKPEYLIAVMNFETGSSFNPCIQNSIGATGLIQFTRSTALNLKTTTSELCKMTQVEQLDYVYKYLQPYKGKMNTLSSTYMAVFLPKGVGKEENFVLSKEGDSYYKNNKGLDINKDTYITVGEATTLVTKNYNSALS